MFRQPGSRGDRSGGSTVGPRGFTAGIAAVGRAAAELVLVGRIAAGITLVGTAAVAGFPAPADAQEPVIPPVQDAVSDVPGDSVELVDRIVAIVGDTAILRSELYQEFFRMRTQGATIPPEGSEEWNRLARQVVATAADRLLVLQEAKRSDVTVTEDEVEQFTEQRFQEIRSQFQSDQAMQQEIERSGMNMLQYREMLRAEVRAELLIQRFRQSLAASGALPPVVITEEEIVSYFEEQTSDQMRPATVSFNLLRVRPLPSPAARDSALAIADSAMQELDEGEDFSVVARRYSEDPGSRDRGGELGWLRRGDVVPTFGDAAWGSRPGRVVGPVATRFGLHIIRVENTRGGERFIRHILIRPQIEQEDVEAARERAEEFADSLRAGVTPDRLKRHAAVLDDQVRFDQVPVDRVAEQYGPAQASRVSTVAPGTVLEPFPVSGPAGTEFVLFQVLEYRPAGPYRLEDLRDRIRDQLRQQKQLEAYIDELRANAYIKVML